VHRCPLKKWLLAVLMSPRRSEPDHEGSPAWPWLLVLCLVVLVLAIILLLSD
jgi:hypothetical protein